MKPGLAWRGTGLGQAMSGGVRPGRARRGTAWRGKVLQGRVFFQIED